MQISLRRIGTCTLAAGPSVPRRGVRMSNEDVLLTPREAATALGVSYPTVKQWILAGKIKTTKTPGGHHRIRQSALAPLLKSVPDKPRIDSR